MADILREKLQDRLAVIEADERIAYPPANVNANAPLALEQVALKTEANTLRWALGLPRRQYHGRDEVAPPPIDHSAEPELDQMWRSLSDPERDLLFWRLDHPGRRAPRRLSSVRRSMHAQGLLRFDDSSELSELGERLLAHVVASARARSSDG